MMKDKDMPLSVTEYHTSHADPPNQIIQQIITTWLTKELHK